MFSKRLDVDNLDGVLECYEALESKLSEEVDCASLLIILAYLWYLVITENRKCQKGWA